MTERPGLHTVLAQSLPAYLRGHRLNADQYRVVSRLQQCRTEALGGWHWQCDQCEHSEPRYHSCRDRHCPRCQWRASQAWYDKQHDALLPVNYFHLVFTLPHTLNGWVAQHPEVLYRLLFASAWATLQAFGADPKRLGGQLGMSAVLHTWGQNLTRHVHLHCLVPGGVLTAQGQWRAAKGNYLFPVKALSRHFRGRMVSALRQAYEENELPHLSGPEECDRVLNELMDTQWVVYTKAYIHRPETVVEYLARYTHRIALTNTRLLAVENGQVRLRYKDYRDGDRHKVMTLSGEELIRRFLLHVLPKGLMRIRHFGFLANRVRRRNLQRIRLSLAEQTPATSAAGMATASETPKTYPCPRCRAGKLRAGRMLAPVRWDRGG